MTREEAIEILNRDDDSMRKGYFCTNDFLAIEVLKSEEPILDKIYADIQKLRGCSCSCSDGIIDDVEDIIDKYKAEMDESEE